MRRFAPFLSESTFNKPIKHHKKLNEKQRQNRRAGFGIARADVRKPNKLNCSLRLTDKVYLNLLNLPAEIYFPLGVYRSG